MASLFTMIASAIKDVGATTAKIAATAGDDLAAASKLAMASADDVASQTATATSKAASVGIDDLAVGADFVGGMTADREIPVIWQIAIKGLRNKLLIAAALMLIQVLAPRVIDVFLLLGAIYLALEAGHGLMEMIHGGDEADSESHHVMTEMERISKALKTDFVLSIEMMVIALNALDGSMLQKAISMGLIAVVMTTLIYGTITLIVRLDDIGLWLERKQSKLAQSFGKTIGSSAPKLMTLLAPIGTVAMAAVAGGIAFHLLHVQVEGLIGFGAETAAGGAAGLILAKIQHAWEHRKR